MKSRRKQHDLDEGADNQLFRVTKALKSLSVHRGISQVRVMAQQDLLELPIVDAELARLGIVDRSVAAYEAIVCSVNRGIGRTDFRTILFVALNVGGREADTLEKRRYELQQQLNLTSSTYERREMAAFTELASLLLRSTKSACGGGRDAPLEIVLVPPHGGNSRHELEIRDGDTRYLLPLMLIERSEVYRDEIAREILDRLPELASSIATFNARSSVAVYYACERVIDHISDRLPRKFKSYSMTLPQAEKRIQATNAYENRFLYRSVDDDRYGRGIYGPLPRRELRAWKRELRRYESWIASLTQIVSEEMAAIEVRHEWYLVFGEPESGGIEVWV